MNLFPFTSVRSGQQEFMSDVVDTLKEGKNLIAHAPTGIGKTVAVLSPALQYALENSLTVFFLTPKHTQHTIVIETLAKIKEKHNPSFSVVDFVGKQWMCPHRVRDLDSREFHEYCKARKRDETCVHYLNVHKKKNKEKVGELVERILEKPHHSEKIQLVCASQKYCPYEVLIKAGKKSDVILCDYFHIFQPNIREAFLLKLEKELKGMIAVVDEAHNLPGRIRKILSVSLTQNTLKRASKEATVLGYMNLVEDLRDLDKILKGLGKGLKKEDEKYVEKEELTEKIKEKTKREYTELADELEDLGEETLTIPGRHRSYAKTVANFIRSWSGENLGYARILKREKNLALSYRCLDPSIGGKPVFEKTHSNILMSGTLTPLSMYSSIMGLSDERTLERAYPSPFPKENRLTLIVSGVTTKYSKRSGFMYRKYAKTLADLLSCIPGNAAVFYPAYHVMEEILEELSRIKPLKELIIEKRDMKKEERRMLYDRLASSSGNGRVLMGVQAGSFSEGVDYPEGMLDAVFVVGLPLERPNLETQALIDYYDVRFERGWDYGYIYPAMNRALQAAGRCIRSETDRGAIILMDERFRWANYAKCFPPDYDFIVTETPEKYLKKFFSAIERTK